ncbi:hypothetical protein [Chitinophaga sp. YIM B06452]|uniref:DUF6934 family protein n=1 Tax=Chitinophaga sp. YIM B06452 TaxID=3082158 RepID=UPI0031FF10BB
MPLERYEFSANGDFTEFEFWSEGPRGRIRKVVRYARLNERIDGETLHSLSFGDPLELGDQNMYHARSNNGDRDKILATVAFTALEFALRHPEGKILIRGSTPARTRLYQMGMNANWGYIGELFRLEGFRCGQYEEFRRGRNYQYFLAQRKS